MFLGNFFMGKLSVLFPALIILSFFSCSKKNSGCGFQNDNIVAPYSEQETVKAYLDSIGNTTALLDTSGFYYQIVNAGSTAKPGLCSSITVTYTGQLTNGTIFDQETDVIFTLGSLIDGWKKGLPLIEEGGEIKLYVPPSLGYGANSVNTGSLVIPAGSILIFDVHLLNVQ
jgi:FKBP-type peptidyl-prolyl cis-trans isomerase FkpA